MRVDVTTYYLEMTDAQALCPKPLQRQDVEIQQARVPCPELNRFLYTTVGGDWYWLDRLPWTYEQWRAWVEQPTVKTWVAYVAGTPAGYIELEAQAGAMSSWPTLVCRRSSLAPDWVATC